MSLRSLTLKNSLSLLFIIWSLKSSCSTECNKCKGNIQNGRCTIKSNGCEVVCNHGFWGKTCQYGRLKLTKKEGHITDGHKSYNNLSKIMWLIVAENGQNSSIYFEIDELSTECNWDHLYIFDGGSIYSPQLGAFSGTFDIGKMNSNYNVIPQQIVAKSGKAYIYFYSDASVASYGFNISYSIVGNCDCSSNGRCNESNHCSCNPGWTGNICDVKVVNCSNCENGVCNETHCVCNEGFTGEDCAQPTTSSYWTSIYTSGSLITRRASHSSVLIGDWMYVYSGYTAHHDATNKKHIFKYHLIEKKWENVPQPAMFYRWGHTMVAYKNKLILFGGESSNRLVDSVVIFNINSSYWTYPVTKQQPVTVTGHTATMVDDKMYVIFGLTSTGLFPKVQVYDIAQSTWEIIESDSSFLTPRHSHSSVYDKSSGLIYVYGGLVLIRIKTSSKLAPTDSLIAFSPSTRKWSLLAPSHFKQSFHSAVILDEMMLVYGGNPYVDNKQQNIQCQSSKLLSFDFACQQWKSIELPQPLARYGHTAVAKQRTMYIFGGFNGVLLNDLLTYTHGNCSLIRNETECSQKYFSEGCFWESDRCVNKGSLGILPVCPSNHIPPCSNYKSCSQCTSSIFGCGWSNEACMAGGNGTCPVTSLDGCRHNYNCNSCSEAGCSWRTGSVCKKTMLNTVSCPKSCAERLESSTCLEPKVGCIWCESLQRCIADEFYVAYFPYGQCLEWTTSTTIDQALACTTKKTCEDCHSLPGCGWCEGAHMTGVGHCQKGSDSGQTGHLYCKKWHFIGCPACQCNGHSNCSFNSTICISCRDNTIEPNCEKCAPGYHGDSKNGGMCKRCECNGHADICDASTGVCQCKMKGVTGDHCERCSESTYIGNATNGGFCFYQLTPDFIYRINVSDRTNFNFISSPVKSDRDTEVSVDIIKRHKTFHAKLNISVGSDLEEERFLITNKELSSKYKQTFSKDNYDFGYHNFYFKIYIHDVTPHTSVSISIHQPSDNSIDLLQFFIIFLACFIGLLILAVIFWKAKATYDAFRRSRRRNVELVYMTNRPFATIPICFEKPEHLPTKTKPSALTSEICFGNKAAVITVLVQMPVCAQAQSSSSAGALCLGSTLVNYNEHPGSKMMNYMKNVKRRRNPFRQSRTSS